MTAGMIVHAPGVLTTVQDLGRWGHQDAGVPVSGVMDPFAHRVANALVGNHPAAATFEITLIGPSVAFDGPAVFAVAGAEFDLLLEEQAVPMWSSIHAGAGAVLRFGERRRGARAYLAVAGGIDVPEVLGSRSTHAPTGMGGFRGRSLRRGDRVTFGASRPGALASVERARAADAAASNADRENGATQTRVRVLAGPQHDRFASDALDRLCAKPYTIESASDRMGYRLAGEALARTEAAEIISDATPLGSIQVPSNGQPLLLMADRQTTGGYPKLATVISADIGIAAQAAPGETLWFELCSRAEALAALVARERRLIALETRVA